MHRDRYVLGLKKKRKKELVSAWSLIAQNFENDYLLSKPRMQDRHKVMKVSPGLQRNKGIKRSVIMK